MKKRSVRRCIAIFLIVISLLFAGTAMGTVHFGITASAAQTGKITGDLVNVRVGPGTTYDKLTTVSGDKLQLNYNHEVSILGEDTASNGSVWYQVSFYYGGNTYTGYIVSDYVRVNTDVSYAIDTDFESYMDAQGFPESYKEALRNLHGRYPQWTFIADHVGYDWNTALENESLIGRSLVPSSSVSSWKSTDPRAYDYTTGTWYGFDGASWVAASTEMVAYCMDPRNFLDEDHIFMFEKLAYDANIHTADEVRNVIAGTFMDGQNIDDDNGGWVAYADAIVQAGATSGVSPLHLASRIIQEMGSSGSSASRSGNVSGYEGLYNYFNQGAYAHDGRSAIINGLIYARQVGWTSRLKSIIGGAQHIGSTYINIGQDTLYYEKFDFVGEPYTHQYMTNILAPASEAVNVAKGYNETMRTSTNIVFKIPVFENMPASPVAKPTGNGNPVNLLTSLSVDGYELTPTFSQFVTSYDLIVDDNVSSVTISAQAEDASATLSGTGNVELAMGINTFYITVNAANGATNVYTVNVYRGTRETEGNTTTTAPAVEYKFETYYSSDAENKYIYGITPGTTVTELLSYINFGSGNGYVLNADGTIHDGVVGTGNAVVGMNADGEEYVRYTVILFGDVNGDGELNSMDMLYLKRHLLAVNELEGVYFAAANTNRADDGITSMDMLYLKRHILGISSVNQQ
jgi:beta-N-acetylglucosaminidase